MALDGEISHRSAGLERTASALERLLCSALPRYGPFHSEKVFLWVPERIKDPANDVMEPPSTHYFFFAFPSADLFGRIAAQGATFRLHL